MIRPLGTILLGISLLGAASVASGAPETSLRPVARQTIPQEAVVARALVRPIARPLSEQEKTDATRAASLAFLSPEMSIRPFSRPDSVVQEVFFGRRKKRKGSVCGNLDIQGEEIGDVPGKLNGCGVSDAVQVRSVSGVLLSRPATMNCTTARALNTWVEKGVKPAFRRRGPVVEMRVAAHYACRTRNNRPGAKISEHGKGKAIDISAFTMNDGEVITVAESWGQGAAGRMLRKVWKSACGPFGTVLGPQSDAYHRDHFHVDTASYRSGSYCK